MRTPINQYFLLPLFSLILFFIDRPRVQAQAYTRYMTGDSSDVQTTTTPGTCLMGGATENVNAMRWWMQRAGGGDVLVLRCTGSDGYNNYLYKPLS